MTQSVPASMKAIEISEPGGPDMLRPCIRPVPQPGAGEVLVKVAAAGVNFPDVAQRRGNYPPPAGASDLPGLEIAGTVVAQGPGVSGPAPGDELGGREDGAGPAVCKQIQRAATSVRARRRRLVSPETMLPRRCLARIVTSGPLLLSGFASTGSKLTRKRQ